MDYTSIHEEQIRGPADRLELGREGEGKIKNIAWVVLFTITG